MNLKYYKDRRGNWRWTLTSRGNVIGASTEGYATKAKAIANFERIVTKGASAKVEVVEPVAKKAAKKAPARTGSAAVSKPRKTAKKAVRKTAKKAARKKAAPASLPAAPAPSYDGF